jgi:DNA-binding NarL/FixJ family response regulator
VTHTFDPAEDGTREKPILAEPGETRRFLPGSRGFLRRTQLVNALVGRWPLVVGTGSWLEAHLVARMGAAARLPVLKGCGVTEREVWELVEQVLQEEEGAPLVVLVDSLAKDQGRRLMRRLHQLQRSLPMLLLVQDERWLNSASLQECKAQAIVHVQSFGSGTVIRALQALRRGESYLDPRLQAHLERVASIQLSVREQQVLEGLAQGLTNKQIGLEEVMAATTVRDHVSRLCRKLGAANRTEVVSRAISLGLVQGRS